MPLDWLLYFYQYNCWALVHPFHLTVPSEGNEQLEIQTQSQFWLRFYICCENWTSENTAFSAMRRPLLNSLRPLQHQNNMLILQMGMLTLTKSYNNISELTGVRTQNHRHGSGISTLSPQRRSPSLPFPRSAALSPQS